MDGRFNDFRKYERSAALAVGSNIFIDRLLTTSFGGEVGFASTLESKLVTADAPPVAILVVTDFVGGTGSTVGSHVIDIAYYLERLVRSSQRQRDLLSKVEICEACG